MGNSILKSSHFSLANKYIINGKKIKQAYPHSPFLFNTALEVLATARRQEKEISIQIRN